MKRQFLKAATLSTCLAASALPSYGFDLFGLFDKENSVQTLLEHVPNDTLLLIAKEQDKSLIKEMDKWIQNNPWVTGNPYQEMFANMDIDEPGANLLLWLVEDYYATAPKGYAELYKHYGLDESGASVIYTDGIYPVVRIALTDETTFPALLQQAAKNNEYELQQQKLGDESIYAFPLIDENDEHLTLGFMVKDKVLTATFFTHADDDAAKKARFALTEVKDSQAPGKWQADGKSYKLDKYLRGYLDFVSIAKAVVQPDNRAHQQLAALVGDDFNKFEQNLNQQCQQEIIGLISQSPRIVFGSQKQNVVGDNINYDLTTVLELTNSDVKTNLTKLRGFLPSYILDNNELGLGFALALDTNQLAPVATELWTQFTEIEFDCDVLQTAQEKVKELNPAIIGIGTAMIQGASGASVGIFDFQLDDSNPLGGTVDALVSLTAKQPQVLASMATQFVPFLSGVVVPDDGSAVNLKSDTVPMDIYVANKGSHLVVYSGEKSKAAATKLLDENPDVNGIASFKLDYKLAGELMMRAAKPIVNAGYNDDDCTHFYRSALTVSGLPIKLSSFSDITKSGFESNYEFDMNFAELGNKNQSIAGSYQLEYLDYDCTWVTIGTDELNDDKSGVYYEMDDAGACRTYESEYTWERAGDLITQDLSSDRYRDDCESEWVEDEVDDFTCSIVNQSGSEFYCISSEDGESTLYRYVHQ
ncbi:MAG: hypothetical protein P8X74_03080 [Reinekea sp.]